MAAARPRADIPMPPRDAKETERARRVAALTIGLHAQSRCLMPRATRSYIGLRVSAAVAILARRPLEYMRAGMWFGTDGLGGGGSSEGLHPYCIRTRGITANSGN